MDDLDDEDDGDLDTDDPNDEDDAHHSNESDHSDESDEVVTEAPTNGPETPIFSPIVPTIETFDGRGDSLAYGLRSRSKKLHVSDSQVNLSADTPRGDDQSLVLGTSLMRIPHSATS